MQATTAVFALKVLLGGAAIACLTGVTFVVLFAVVVKLVQWGQNRRFDRRLEEWKRLHPGRDPRVGSDSPYFFMD